ncbi:hypothetical protein LMH87_009513 [Akanthomyces muscarius]|uniref:Uncharacterized protein n=1 Tax=Akanthomyces muscarius TaxID=2231603 RepID=A0A9W8QC84_AKAMU|nr:hypothetical protein LMH87_009513 [Akanthomyces muscarius]KAJ4153000.1 hypothetical protein LMH87_009513 [Akanthomyces muscarius]
MDKRCFRQVPRSDLKSFGRTIPSLEHYRSSKEQDAEQILVHIHILYHFISAPNFCRYFFRKQLVHFAVGRWRLDSRQRRKSTT